MTGGLSSQGNVLVPEISETRIPSSNLFKVAILSPRKKVQKYEGEKIDWAAWSQGMNIIIVVFRDHPILHSSISNAINEMTFLILPHSTALSCPFPTVANSHL